MFCDMSQSTDESVLGHAGSQILCSTLRLPKLLRNPLCASTSRFDLAFAAHGLLVKLR